MKKNKIIFCSIIIIIVVILAIAIEKLYINNNDIQEKKINNTYSKNDDKDTETTVLSNLSLLDKNKDLVYTLTKIKTFEFPVINIDSPDVKLINAEIKEHYGFTSEADLKGLSETSYEYYINGNILSVIVKKGGNQSVFANSYNINLEDGTRIIGKDLISIKEKSETKVKKAVLTAVEDEYKKVIVNDRSFTYGKYWDTMKYADEIEKAIHEYTSKVNNLNNMFLDQDNNLCMIISFVHPGGDWMCTRTVIVNITDDYSVEELKLNNGEGSDNTEETAKKITEESMKNYVTDLIQPEPLAYPSTPDSITTERAIELAKGIFGTKSQETGYEIQYTYYAWVKDSDGKEYYIINMNWFNGTDASWIAAVCVSVDGKSYKQLGTKPNCQNGDTITDMLDGGNF